MRAVKIYSVETSNFAPNNLKSKVDGSVNISTSVDQSKMDQSSSKLTTNSVSSSHMTNNNSIPSNPVMTNQTNTSTNSTVKDVNGSEAGPPLLSSGNELISSEDESKSPRKRKRKRKHMRKTISTLAKPAGSSDSDSSVSTSIGDTGDSEEGKFNLLQPECTPDQTDRLT